MLHSMTGFGKASGAYLDKKITIEIRSLNSKSMDLSVRMNSLYKEKEIEIRKIISNRLERGKVEANIFVENTGEERSFLINKAIARAYYNDIKELEMDLGQAAQDPLGQLLRMPDIFVATKEELTADEWVFIQQLLEQALNHIEEFRMQEGQSLQDEFNERIGNIHSLLTQIPRYEQERIATIKERMQKALDEKLGQHVDQNRLEQEFIIFIEKLDVTEEKVRLANHLDYFLDTMKTGKDAGKKLGFITQEIGREVNTLGSKSNHVEMQKIVVEMKDNLEKIKEQVLNTL